MNIVFEKIFKDLSVSLFEMVKARRTTSNMKCLLQKKKLTDVFKYKLINIENIKK